MALPEPRDTGADSRGLRPERAARGAALAAIGPVALRGPEYEWADDHGIVRWRIRDGLLVARAGRGCGFLALDVRRRHTVDGRYTVRVEVEVANFYPAIAVGFSLPVYEATQSSIHVLVTHAFMRSLATLDLAESKVRRLAQMPTNADTAPPPIETTQP